MSQFVICAMRIPITMVSSLRQTRRPRMPAGEISAMYIGLRLDASPMARPPQIRQATNCSKVPAIPVPMLEIVKTSADARSAGLRPNLSLRTPESIAPARQPTSAQLIAQPCTDGDVRPKWAS